MFCLYLTSTISADCPALLGKSFTLRKATVGFVCNDAFVFIESSLGFGAGDLTRLKLSMDLKQRFTEVRCFLFHCHQTVGLLKTTESVSQSILWFWWFS